MIFKKKDILTLGRMAHNKGYDLLIKALPTVFELVPEARLVAAVGGEGSEQDIKGINKLKELANSIGVSDRIVWSNFVPDEDLADFYRAAAVFSMPSRYEPFGMVAIEAMACGTPTVVTTHGGLKDVIEYGRNALFADPHRKCELATMLSLPLLYPELNNELSVAGARFARSNFGWTGIAKKMLEVFSYAVNLKSMQPSVLT